MAQNQGGGSSSLSSSEWGLVAAFLLLIASFVVISKVNIYRTAAHCDLLTIPEEKILVVAIDGAVKKPGEYSISPGTKVGEVLRKAKPTLDANLRDLPLKEEIDHSQKIHVKKLTEIQVCVRGAIVGEELLFLPPGSRICDLRTKVIFTDETDGRFFKRKKLLKDGDVIEVPKKTVE